MSSSTEHRYLSPTSPERPDHSTISSACEVGKKWWWNCRHEFERSIKSTALAIFEVESESCWLGFLQAVPFGGMNTILLRTSNFSKHSITVFWTLLENLLLSTFWPQLATRCKAKYSSLCTGYRVRFTAVTWYSCSGLSKHQTHQLATHQRPQLPWRLDMSRLQKNQSPLIAMARQIGLRCRFSGHKFGAQKGSLGDPGSTNCFDMVSLGKKTQRFHYSPIVI